MRFRYSRWDGTQDPFSPEMDVGELLDEIGDDLLSGFAPDYALRRLMRRGISGRMGGLEDLRRRLREQRRRMAQNLNIEGPMAEVQEKLNEIMSQERETLAKHENEDARMREAFLDSLPPNPARQLTELKEYKFMDQEAQQKFNELVESLQKEILNSYFKELTGAMQNMSPEDVARVREMLKDLNEMIRARNAGDPYDFPGFMQKYGDFFPENPRNLDELLEVLARRMAAMSRLMASLSPEQRRQLQELARSVLEDMDLAFQMSQLSQELRELMPHLPWDEPAPSWGDEPMEMSSAVDALERMGEFEELDEALEGDYAGSTMEDVDEDKLRTALGEQAVTDLRRLKEIEKTLEEAGILTRNRGRLELTARGARRLGERALVKVFEDLTRERPGAHDSREQGGLAEPTGQTRKWMFGDTGQIAVQKSIFNAVLRQASEKKVGEKMTMDAEDFELIEAETRTRTATALLLDLSYSMPLRGNWIPAKKMALALHALIQGKYPSDRLYLIGFSDYARKLEPSDLTGAGVDPVYGTNMQHAFLLARRLLNEHPRATRQVIMVTDGEPTAHLLDNGEYVFSWPPVPETITKTLAEAMRLSSAGITLNVFMLEDAPGLVSFMDKLAKLTGGRVFHTSSEHLGTYVLRDFVRHHR